MGHLVNSSRPNNTRLSQAHTTEVEKIVPLQYFFLRGYNKIYYMQKCKTKKLRIVSLFFFGTKLESCGKRVGFF